MIDDKLNNKLVIYTDGSCIKNPNGPGGWAFCVIYNDQHLFSVSGSNISTTNNRMELQAVIESLKFILNMFPTNNLVLYTDSQWVLNCANGVWKRKANLDLWSEYDQISKKFIIKYIWVKAHNGNKYNTIVDQLALSESRSVKVLK